MHTTFGKLKDGREAKLYTIKSAGGTSVSVTDYGASLVKVIVPDKHKKPTDVVLGYDDAAGYENGTFFFGATIGRNGNRIANAKFSIDGNTYTLEANENGNSLHSNPNGYDSRIWDVIEESEQMIRFKLESPDGDQGFPGNLSITLTYALDDDNALSLHYEGICDQDTVVNMTNHSYFNLNGQDSKTTILDHMLTLDCKKYTPVIDTASIPTGELESVTGTPLDFTVAKKIGDDIEADFSQLTMVGGYDHNFVIPQTFDMNHAAHVYSKQSGITMDVTTDAPGVQLYTANFVTPTIGKSGAAYDKRSGLCLETQYFPNAVNTPGFASPVLKADQKYDTTTTYKFGIKK